jgi:hypothetical protein
MNCCSINQKHEAVQTERKGTLHCNKDKYLPDAFFANLHTLLALMFTLCRCKTTYVLPGINIPNAAKSVILHGARNCFYINFVRFPVGAGNFSLHHRVQNGSGAHPASYPVGTRGCFSGGKVAGCEADLSPPSSAKVKECVEPYLHSHNTPSWRDDWLRKAGLKCLM